MTWSLEPGPWREPPKPFPANPAEANASFSLTSSPTQIGFCPAAEGVPGGVPVGWGKGEQRPPAWLGPATPGHQCGTHQSPLLPPFIY